MVLIVQEILVKVLRQNDTYSIVGNYTEEELDHVILESEKSGVVDDEEINAFFARWKSLL